MSQNVPMRLIVNQGSSFVYSIVHDAGHSRLAAADVEVGNQRVVVTGEVRVPQPGGEVEVLDLGSVGDESRADQDVVELLSIHVEDVGVALGLGEAEGAELRHVVLLGEDALGLHEGELIEVAGGDDAGLRVLLVESVDEGSNALGLPGALLDAVVDGRASVTVQGGGTTLGAVMNVDGVEGLVLGPTDGAPSCDKGLAAVVPGGVGDVDAARVEGELASLEDDGLISATTLVGLPQLDNVGAEQVSVTNVAAGLAAVLVANRLDLDKVVGKATQGLDLGGEVGESEVGADNGVVGGAVVVLNLLDEDEVRGLHVLNDVSSDRGKMRRLGPEVLNVVRSKGDAAAVATALNGGRLDLNGGLLFDDDSGQGQNAVETEGVGNNTGDLGELVTHLGLGVARAIEGGADESSLGVGILTPVSFVPISNVRAALPLSVMVIPSCSLAPVTGQVPRTQVSPNWLGRVVPTGVLIVTSSPLRDCQKSRPYLVGSSSGFLILAAS